MALRQLRVGGPIITLYDEGQSIIRKSTSLVTYAGLVLAIFNREIMPFENTWSPLN